VFYSKVQSDDIRQLDRAWSKEKILMLLDGAVEIDGDLHVGLSAYQMRIAAQSSTHDFADLIIEAAQLDAAIRNGIVKDKEVRAAMLLRTRLGMAENEIEDALQSSRPGYALLERGIELVQRYQRGQHQQLRRVRANRGEGDQPMCWRCMSVAVARPGEWCGCIDKERKSDRSLTGPGSTYDPAARPNVAEMTDEERRQEIELLSKTQNRGPIPGGEYYRKIVSPVGLHMYSENDLRRSDREFNRSGARADAGGHHRRILPDELIPSHVKRGG
jgi:hypothetical protein